MPRHHGSLVHHKGTRHKGSIVHHKAPKHPKPQHGPNHKKHR